MALKIYTIHNVNTLLKAIDRIKRDVNLKCEWILTLKQKRSKRSVKQNRLFYLLISALAVELGYEKDEFEAVIKDMFLPKKEIEILNRTCEMPVSTKTLTTLEFKNLIEAVYDLADAQGVKLLRPDDRYFPEFCEYYDNFYK